MNENNKTSIKTYAIPEEWVWTKLGEVCLKPQYGWTTSATTEGALNLLRTTDITSGTIDWDSVPFCKEEPPEKEKYLLKDGDIVISRAGSIGYSYLIKNPKEAVFASYLIRFKPLIDEQYLAYFLKSPSYWGSISEKSLGIAVPNVNATKLRQITIPLPPLPEQHRIVAKIEELFTKLDAGVSSLEKAKAQLKRYRQAVLKSAMEGRLTEEWREAHKGELEPASVLLERIKEERKKNAKGKYKELPLTEDLPELPEGWVWTRIGEVANEVNPGFPSGKHNKEGKGIPHLRPMNINIKGEIDLSEVKYVQPENYDRLLKWDVLFNNTNSPKLLGKTAYIKEDTNWAYSNHMTRIRLNTSLLNSAWISYTLHTLFLSGFFEMRCTHHVNQASINSTFLAEKVIIPLPPLPEQHRIVEEIERCLSVADEVEKTVKQSLKQSKRLRQSILKRAFEGKLVPQDPTEEPASVLLERIKEEKTAEKKTKKGKLKEYEQKRLI
jgi:Restriction endonuclease S subunits